MNIFLSAGDPSGDVHAANLVRSLKKLVPGVSVTALGGGNLRSVSDNFLVNLVELGGFGFWQPFKLFFKLKGILKKTVIGSWEKARPDKVVLVDYYGFNIFVAREAHKRGIPVYYYISPQVWATRPGRVQKIAKYVKKMLVILPFEEKLYKDAGVDAVFVGNPLIDMVPEPLEGGGRPGDKLTIGLFPGSRPDIFARHIGLLTGAAGLLKKNFNADFLIFCVPELAAKCEGLPYRTVVESDFALRRGLSFALTTSGTVSMENALLGIPMVVYYRLSSFNYFVAKLLVNVPYITMVNILLGRMLVPELIQNEATSENLAAKAESILKDKGLLGIYSAELIALRSSLGTKGVSDRAAGIILS